MMYADYAVSYAHVVARSLQVLLRVLWTRHLSDIEELGRVLERGQTGVFEVTGVILQIVDMVEDFHCGCCCCQWLG